MKSKKFVLAGFVLLAITGLLALAGCKNDSVSETPKYTVTFNANGGSTVASQTVESGQKAKEPAEPELEGSWFLGWYSDEGLAKKFDFNTQITTATTVYAKWSYKLHTKPSILTNYTSSHAPEGEWTYVEFGDWPQTILKGDVTVYEDKSKEMGMFTYYLGSDGNHYVKITAKPYEDTYTSYTYSDGNLVEKDKEVYFKVEPIEWRVLTEDYKAPDGKSTGNALLLAESILTGGIPYYVDNYQRAIGGQFVYANNWQYSTIRAWLNGLDVVKSNDVQENDKTYAGKGFLQTAFTADAQSLIAATTVDNSAASTNPASNSEEWNSGENEYACGKTTDWVFLLSEKEATTGAHLKKKGITDEDYGFDEYSKYVGDGTTLTSTRSRVTTDYAKATGVSHNPAAGYVGWWWLRSPFYDLPIDAVYINGSGGADANNVKKLNGGVVPALSISLQ